MNVLVGTVGVIVMELKVQLYRTIGHFIDYGRRPQPYDADLGLIYYEQVICCYLTG